MLRETLSLEIFSLNTWGLAVSQAFEIREEIKHFLDLPFKQSHASLNARHF